MANKMNYETLKHIYTEVLINQNKIQYNGEDKYTITRYYHNGKKHWEKEYHQGLQHGKDIGWWENGKIDYEHYYLYGEKTTQEKYRKHQLIEKLSGIK